MSATITHAQVRMYRMGTGDCFVIKFFAGDRVKFKMMIDCGTWQGTRQEIARFVEDLKNHVDNEIDLLVVTHEHKDHVYGFDACEDLFRNDFTIKQVWLGWTEKDGDGEVENWKQEYGNKKKALHKVAGKMAGIVADENYQKQFLGEWLGPEMLAGKKAFSDVVQGFTDLHLSVRPGEYVGGLDGMRVVKENLVRGNVRYCRPGEVIENVENAEGLRFFVLGPPLSREAVAKEGAKGETFDHNKDLNNSQAFAAAVLAFDDANPGGTALPFEEHFLQTPGGTLEAAYAREGAEWRKIDFEWLAGAGSLALRMNSLTNNLSLALAIEFQPGGRVMLFPGDAEFGSWESWHKIKWPVPSRDEKKHLTEDLLNRTVFYKVAHHLSHNGTAKRQGVEMMIHKDLAAMATLDYGVISSGWKKTMPNRALLRELITRTKGRLVVMQEAEVYYDEPNGVLLADRIREERAKMSSAERQEFTDAYEENSLYLQYTVKANDAPANP